MKNPKKPYPLRAATLVGQKAIAIQMQSARVHQSHADKFHREHTHHLRERWVRCLVRAAQSVVRIFLSPMP